MSRIVCVLKTSEGGLWAVPQMLECRARGHEISFVIPAGGGRLRDLLDAEGVAVIESRFDFSFKPSFALLSGLWRLRRQIRKLAPDVVFYHLIASALAARISTLGMRVRRVHMVAGPLYLDSRPIRVVERALMRLDDVVIAGSEHTAIRYGQLGMPAERVKAIPYGVDVSRFCRGADIRTSLYDCEASDFVAIMVAYIYAPKSAVYPGVGIKGHETLLAAWREFAEGKRDVKLALVGSGFDERGEVHRQRLFAEHQVEFDRTIQWSASVLDVRPYYSSADVSISPSLSENHGAAVEASAMSCPSIVSSAGALPEVVDVGLTGWIVPPADVQALVAALEHAYEAKSSGRLASMGVSARERVEARFDGAKCAGLVADVLTR